MKRNGPDENRAAAVAAETTPARIAGSLVKDRWHQLQDLIEASNMPASDTAVYNYLLKKSDWVSAQLQPQWTPTRAGISRATRVCLRQVHYSVAHLQRHGWLFVRGRHKSLYTLMAGTNCDCTGRVHVADVADADAVPDVSAARAVDATDSRLVQRRTSEPVSPNGQQDHVADVADVSHSLGMEPRPGPGSVQLGATNAPRLVQRIGATPQVSGPVPLGGSEREAVENRQNEKQVTVKNACPRHQTIWGPHSYCPACNALKCSL